MFKILRNAAILALAGTALLGPAATLARDASNPDWPCVQRKIETLTSTQVWEGPAVEDMTAWRDDPEIGALVARLARRATPVKEAEAAVKTFAERAPATSRAERLTLVFAGLFATLQDQRRTVMARIERMRKAQGERAAELERQSTALADLEEKAAADATAAQELAQAQEEFDLAQRIFQERQDSMPFACELPVRIDQRAFTLGKAIHDVMPPDATASAPQ